MKRTLVLTLAASLGGIGVARADVVLQWNAIMQATVAAQNPFAQARVAAITQLAVFEAVNAITGGYEPYLGTIEAPAGASVDAAAVAAAYRVLKTYFPGDASLDSARASSLAAIPDSQAKTDGISVGEAAAAAMIALRSNDGSAPPQFYAPSSSAPGEWQRTAGCPAAGGAFLHWRNVTPFGLQSSSQFRSEPPPALTSNLYRGDYEEVTAVGGRDSTMRSTDRSDAARFYAVVLAVATWNPAVRQVAAAEGTSTSDTARALALLNVAISDALVSVMETKYHYVFWRPETAIPEGDADGNDRTHADPGFVPFIPTPCFPGYPSAHASASYAAKEIARRIFGAGGHSIVLTSPPSVGVTLTYTTFKEITRAIDDARVDGGIHFRFDQEAGAVQGRSIGKYISKNLLRPVGGHVPHD
jgi:hypothetical protein